MKVMMWTIDKGLNVLFLGSVCFFLSIFFYLTGLADFLLFFPGTWILTSSIYLILGSLQVDVQGKAVLITGCDSGFGEGLAHHLHQLGFRVFAGCLLADASGEGAQRLRRVSSSSNSSGRMHVLQLDVTNGEQVKSALHEVKRILPSSEVLWGVVNNAGVSTFGAVEWVPMTTFRRLADVNIFGCVGVTKAFLPLIRKAKGRFVNITSAQGRMPTPLFSAYDLTKYAIEGFSDCLRNEMKRFGVHVSLVEPGNFNAGTSLNTDDQVIRFSEEMWSAMDDEVKAVYGKQYFNDFVASRILESRSGEANLMPVVQCMTEALTHRFPLARYQPMSMDVFLRVFVAQHLPEWIYDYVIVGFINNWI